VSLENSKTEELFQIGKNEENLMVKCDMELDGFWKRKTSVKRLVR
jgi:hypothetical protein